jgi:hypothetical protein
VDKGAENLLTFADQGKKMKQGDRRKREIGQRSGPGNNEG